eukprot:COSAG01_NODE_28641_length_656_cov_1.263914_1_plen_198_part_10
METKKSVIDFGGDNGSTVSLAHSRARRDMIKNVRMTAAPNTCLFDGGMRYLQNSVVVENQTQPYTAAMAQLVTKTDLAGTDTAGGTLSLRKDVGKALATDVTVDNKADNVNPKQEIISLGCRGAQSEFEIAEPLFLASFQHGYAVGPSDHQLFLTISNDFEGDLLHCPKTTYAGTLPDYTKCINGTPAAAANQAKVYV